MKIHIPDQSFELDESGYGRIKFNVCVECVVPEAAPQPEAAVEAPVSPEVTG